MLEDGRDRYDALVAQNLARVTGFEPNQVALDRLTQRAGLYRYFPLFLGDSGTATCHFTHYPNCSSLFEPDPAIIDLFETMGAWEGWDFHVIKAERVRTTRLDDLHDEIRADYIKIDVQGAELLVLRSGRRCSGDLQVFLRDQGFLLHKLVDVGGRPMRPVRPANLCAPISQVIWADAIFVRELLPARRLRGRRPGQGRHHPSYRPPILRPRRPSFART
jgi:FkbM family methyltransferase